MPTDHVHIGTFTRLEQARLDVAETSVTSVCKPRLPAAFDHALLVIRGSAGPVSHLALTLQRTGLLSRRPVRDSGLPHVRDATRFAAIGCEQRSDESFAIRALDLWQDWSGTYATDCSSE